MSFNFAALESKFLTSFYQCTVKVCPIDSVKFLGARNVLHSRAPR